MKVLILGTTGAMLAAAYDAVIDSYSSEFCDASDSRTVVSSCESFMPDVILYVADDSVTSADLTGVFSAIMCYSLIDVAHIIVACKPADHAFTTHFFSAQNINVIDSSAEDAQPVLDALDDISKVFPAPPGEERSVPDSSPHSAQAQAQPAPEYLSDAGYTAAPVEVFSTPAPASAPPVASRAVGSQPRILVIDDDPVQLRLTKSYLEEYYEVFVTTGWQAAHKYLSSKIPDLILLDYVMPDVNGPMILRLLRNDPKWCNIPVIFLTGIAEREKVMRALEDRPNGYVIKPVKRSDIIARIIETLDEGGTRNAKR